MGEFFLLWSMHGLGWFTASALSALARGNHNALRITNSFALGFMSSALHVLVLFYLRRHQ